MEGKGKRKRKRYRTIIFNGYTQPLTTTENL
jgi:hypothetical protein